MTVSRRSALFAGAAASVSALIATAQGQNPGTGVAPANAPAGEDPLLAACMLIGGRKQIENCSYIQEKLTTEDARAFCKAEIEEHQKIKAQLQKMGFDYPVKPAQGQGQAQAQRQPQQADAIKPVVVNVGTKAPLPPEAIALVAIDHEVAEQCIANYRAEMDKLQGVKRDQRFIGHQLDEHLALKDKVETYRRHASAAMKPTLEEGLKTINTHIETCKKLMEKLDQQKEEKGDEKKEEKKDK